LGRLQPKIPSKIRFPNEDNYINESMLKRFTVLTAAAGLSTWAIDMAATQVGLPSMQVDLGISVTASQWILNLTLMLLAGVVTVGGALGDRLGRLRIFRLGIIGIIAGALLAFGGGFAGSFTVVLMGRGLEGLAAGLFLPASTALLLDVFPLAERGGAQGKMVMISMVITAFAPTIIGVLIQAISWPITYLLTATAGGVALFLASRVKYEQKQAAQTSFDVAGSLLLFTAVTLLTVGIMQAGESGLTSPTVLLMVGAGLVVGVVLVFVSLRKPHPLIQFRLFKIGTVSIALLVTFMRFLPNVLMGAFVARYVQQALGLSPTSTGLLMILPVLMQVVAAPIGGKMLDTGGPRKPVVLGVALLAAGLVFLAFGFQMQSLWLVFLGTLLGGLGFSFTNPAAMAALSATPLEQRGMLAGVLPLAGNFGTAFFVALVTAGMSAFMASYLAVVPGASDAAALSSALSKLAWISLLATLVTLFVATKLPKPEAAPTQNKLPAGI
jgi:MFS family permease